VGILISSGNQASPFKSSSAARPSTAVVGSHMAMKLGQEADMGTEAIAEALGGRKLLHRVIKKPGDLAKLVREGLPATSVIVLAEKLDLGSTALSRKLGIPLRTMTRRLSHGSRLTAAEVPKHL
jgi:uncharacterized protein (DUF2384 family)